MLLVVILVIILIVFLCILKILSKLNQPRSNNQTQPGRGLVCLHTYNRLYDNYEDKNYIIFDLETTGLNPEINEIIEIGAIKFINGQEDSRFHTYIRPRSPIPPNITVINHITNTMVADAPSFDLAFSDFILFIKDFQLVAHNAAFDVKFLQTQSQKYLDNPVADTLYLARQNKSGLSNYKLETIKKYYKMDAVSHTAIGDCEVTAKLYQDTVFLHSILHPTSNTVPSVYSKKIDETTIDGQFFKAVLDILTNNGIDTEEVYKMDGDNTNIFLCRGGYQWSIVFIKTTGRLRYWLIDTPVQEFVKTHPDLDIPVTESSKAEGGAANTRLEITKPEQLIEFQPYIVDAYSKAVDMLNTVRV